MDIANARDRDVGGVQRIREYIIPSNAGGVGGYARYCTQHWAISIVSSICEEKSGALTETQGHPLQMSRRALLWAILHGWNTEHLRSYIQSIAPTIWGLLNNNR